jgi:putative ABC transport system permease protein
MWRISTVKIAVSNIAHRRFRSVCITLLIAMTTLSITGGTLLGFSLKNGVDSIRARLGADAMVVPQSAGKSVEGALLNGLPATFYISIDTVNRVMKIDGIERATAQLFVSTFDSEHCAALVQIIGYDPATDFVVAPWLTGSNIAEPGYCEVVIGGSIEQLRIGDKMPIFAVKLKVVGILEKTGMGFDNSIFVNLDTAKMLLAEYERFEGATPLPDGASANSVVSAILIDLLDDADIVEFQRNINLEFRDERLSVATSQALLASTSKNLDLLTGILAVLLVAMWAFSVSALAIIFALSLNERQREFGILRAIGATRRKLMAILLAESSILCGVGAFAGVGVICLIVFPYSALLERVMRTAYLPPQSGTFALLLVFGLLSGSIIGPLSSVFSAAIIGKNDAFVNLQEGM